MSVEELRKYPAARYEFQHTQHQYTPAGKFKPNPDVLLSIIRHVGASPDDCVYVGDSLVKDVAMAKDAAVTDAWAKYGQSQTTAGYQLLREITHWTDEEVKREKKISQREVKPSHELTNFFSDLFEQFQFGTGQSYYELASKPPLSIEEKEGVIEAWKTTINVQQHFNDISLRIRGLFITLILALSAAIGFLAEKDLKIAFGNVIVHYAMLIPIAGMIGTLMFYFMDRYWYHRLLIGSVIHGSSIERRHRFEIPEIGPTVAIADNSPIKLTRRITRWLANLVVTHDAYKEDETLHSTGKIELFYKPIVYLFLLVFVVMLLGRGVTIGQKSIFDITLKNIAAIDSSKAVNPPNAHR